MVAWELVATQTRVDSAPRTMGLLGQGCQLMVVGANLLVFLFNTNRNPQLGVRRRRELRSAQNSSNEV